jgi:hypothetical protein
MAAMAAAAAAALRRPHHLRGPRRGASRPCGRGGGGGGGGGGGTTLNLTDLERRAAWKARWMKDDPTADVNSVMFEDDAGSEQIPDDLSFGYFENSLKWEIYKKHKEVSRGGSGAFMLNECKCKVLAGPEVRALLLCSRIPRNITLSGCQMSMN